MSADQEVATLQEHWANVMQLGAMIALYPIEEWLQAFDRAEAIAPIVDPTLYRNFIYSGKGEVIKNVLTAALHLKQAILKAQKEVTENPRLQK